MTREPVNQSGEASSHMTAVLALSRKLAQMTDLKRLPLELLLDVQREVEAILSQLCSISIADRFVKEQAEFRYGLIAVQEQLSCLWQHWLLWRQVTALALGADQVDCAYGSYGEMVYMKPSGNIVA